MKKSEFEEIQRKYEEGRKRLEGIAVGDLIWKAVPQHLSFEYFPAVVKGVNVDGDYVDVIDVSLENEEKRYVNFLTESEFLQEPMGPTEDDIRAEYEKYADVIKSVKS